MKSLLTSVAGSLLILLSLNVQAQNATYDRVYSILSTNCAGSGCHSGSIPGFDVSEHPDTVYNDLIGAGVLNAAADTNGNSMVLPGYPHRSFLLKKVAYGLGTDMSLDLALKDGEGADMPLNRPALSPYEVETIRQWILAGASKTENYPTADSALLAGYYNDPNRLPFMQAPAPPAEGEGFQVHLGPIFHWGNEEKEFFIKHDLFLEDDIEVTGLDVKMNDESHHYILRKFQPGTKDNWADGLEPLNALTAFDSDKDYVMAWQNDERFDLPATTAYYWDSETALDLNFHMLNYNNKILPGEVFMNVSTQPKGTADKEMVSKLVNNANIFLQPGATETLTATDGLKNISIWTLASHTHERGEDFDIYLRNSDGSRGPQIYEGMLNYATGVNPGFYDWEHPPTRFWEDLYTPFHDSTGQPTGEYNGFIYEALYENTTNGLLTFGFTTEDEMMIFYVQYIDGYYKVDVADTTDSLTSIAPINAQLTETAVYPNPFSDNTKLTFGLSANATVSIEVFDLLGRNVLTVAKDQPMDAGEYNVGIMDDAIGGNGIYLLELTVDGKRETIKLLKTE